MKRGSTGRYEVSTGGGEAVRAFVPAPLPPSPSLQLDGSLLKRHEAAVLALGRLDTLSTLLPDTGLFLYSYVRTGDGGSLLSIRISGYAAITMDWDCVNPYPPLTHRGQGVVGCRGPEQAEGGIAEGSETRKPDGDRTNHSY
jgi:hypothetical protein